MSEEQTKDLQDYLSAFKRRRANIAAIATVIFGFGLIVALAWPPTYRSAATILIEEQQIPAELVQSTVTSYAAQRIQTISQRVMTRTNLMDIVKKFDLYVDERKRETTEEILMRMRENIALDMISAEVIDPRTGRPTAATIAFSLAFLGEHPQQVQRVANELTTLYLQENIKTRSSRAQETYTFLADEAKRLGTQIEQMEKRLADFRAANADRLPELQPVLREQIDRSEREFLDIENQLRALEDRRFYLQSELAQLDPHGQDVTMSPGARLKSLRTQYAGLVARYSADHPDVARMKREIEALERETGQVDTRETLLEQRDALQTELAAAQEKYSPEHPDVVRLTRAIEGIEAALATAPTAPAEMRAADNPAYVSMRAQVQSVDNSIHALNAKRATLEKRRDDLEARLTSIPQVEGEYRVLSRDLQNATTKYQEIKAKQMQAQIGQQLETESKGERFTLIDPPILPEEPLKPNRPAIVFLSLVLALASGLGYAVAVESMDKSVRGAKGVLATLQVAPLSVIPYLASDQEAGDKRRRRRNLLIAVAAILTSALLLVHVFVSPLDVLWYHALRKATNATGIDL
jgi:uncharacterized protein involved in exopolysaccharide biosynthesis